MTRSMKILGLIFAGCFGAGPLSAQLPQATAAALGLGESMTASARGFAAVANNPAGLGHPDSPAFSLVIPALSAESGLGPVTLGDLVDWEGQLVPDAVKGAWLQAVTASGSQAGSASAGVTPLALSVGRLGFQLSTYLGGSAALNPDAVELIMYGNAGVTGGAEDFDLAGSSLDGFALSTAALSTGFSASDRLYLGATAKYTVGHTLLVGRDLGSSVVANPAAVALDFPVLIPRTDEPDFNNGSGIGLDLGGIYVGERVTFGATIHNVVSTFEWSLDGFSYVAGQALFDQGTSQSDFEERPATGAPVGLVDEVDALTLKPVFALGAEMALSPDLDLRAEMRKRVTGGLEVGPAFHLGVGAELRSVPVLPLRGHLAVVSGGVQVGGGATLVLGPAHLGLGVAVRTGDAATATLGMFSLSFGGD